MGLGKKLKKAAKSAVKTVKSVGSSIEKGVKSGLKNIDPTSVEGRQNLLGGALLGGVGGLALGATGITSELLGKISDSGSGSSSSSDADDTYANLIREQWEDFEKKDMNYIRDYANRIVSGQDITDSLNQATEGVNRGFDLSRNTQLRQQAGLGLGLSQAQTQDQIADRKRNQTASLVDAQNSAYTAAKDRQDALLAGAHMPKTQVER